MIANIRIDQRLIHGQVTQGWAHRLKLSKIIVLSERLSEDLLGQKIMKLGVPDGIEVDFLNPDEVIHGWSGWHSSSDQILILTDHLDEIVCLIEKGIKPESITLGNLHGECSCHDLSRTVRCSDSEIMAVRKILEAGVVVQACSGAQDTPEPIEITQWNS